MEWRVPNLLGPDSSLAASAGVPRLPLGAGFCEATR